MNVPKLRFSEFNEEWKCKKIGNISKIYDGTHETPNYTTSGVKFVSVENINNLLTTQKYVSKDDFDKYKIKPKINDIFMTRIGDIGTSNILLEKIDLAYYVSLALIRPNEEIYPMYLNQYIKSYFFQKELYNRTIHVAFPKKINTGEINNCLVNFPEIKEQEKISNVLALIDKKIELQSKKIEDLKLYKKGLILSLKKDSINWINVKISNLFNITRGTVIPKTELSDVKTSENIYPVYSSQTSNDGILGYSNTYDFDGKYLTWTTDGANAGKVFYRNGKFRCTNVCGVLFENNIKYTNELLAELLNYETPKHVSYVGNPKLMNNVMADIKFNIPNIEIQNKVSNFISTINTKIKYENDKLNKLQELKKGLMQSMFV